jgi:hypothetical protein
MTATMTERVAAGAAWLDEHHPGWVDRIDLNVLDLESPCFCVLGQLGRNTDLRGWRPLLARLRLPDWQDVPFGFCLTADEEDEDFGTEAANWSALTREWEALILARLTGWTRIDHDSTGRPAAFFKASNQDRQKELIAANIGGH